MQTDRVVGTGVIPVGTGLVCRLQTRAAEVIP
jgi:hypothetical protein